MNEEIKVVETEQTVVDVVSTENEGKRSFIKPALIVGGITAVVATIVTIANKTKDKRKAKRRAKQIKELEADGYTILEPNDFEGIVDSSVEEN